MDDKMMLVYEHRTHERKLVPGGVSIMSEVEIVMALSANPDIIMVTKAIKAGQTHFDIYKHELISDEVKLKGTSLGDKTNVDVDNKADNSKEVPWRVFLGHEWEGHSFTELVILTPEVQTASPIKGNA